MQLKTLLAVAIGTVMLASTGQAFAGRDDHRGYRGDYHGDRGWDRSRGHYSSHRYSARKWRSEQRRHWRQRRGNTVRIYHNYRHRPDYGAIIGGALIGSAITHSLHEAYDSGRNHGVSGSVTGCYRIERLGGGRERRVELPLSWCR